MNESTIYSQLDQDKEGSVIDYVALTIKGESLNPEEVTHRLGVQPSRAFARGDTTVHPRPTSFGYWRLRIERAGGELNSFLHDLLDALDGHEPDVAELAREYEAQIVIVADLTGHNEGEMNISKSLIQQMATMSVELRFYWLFGEGQQEDPDPDQI
jgi:Domain of unknown function (DUF4279)